MGLRRLWRAAARAAAPALRRAGFRVPAPRVQTLDGSPAGSPAGSAAAREREQELELAELPADLEVGAGLGRGFDAHPARATSGDLESGGGAAAAAGGGGGGAPFGRAAEEDEDVAAERARVLAGGAAGDAIALVGLRKARAPAARVLPRTHLRSHCGGCVRSALGCTPDCDVPAAAPGGPAGAGGWRWALSMLGPVDAHVSVGTSSRVELR